MKMTEFCVTRKKDGRDVEQWKKYFMELVNHPTLDTSIIKYSSDIFLKSIYSIDKVLLGLDEIQKSLKNRKLPG